MLLASKCNVINDGRDFMLLITSVVILLDDTSLRKAVNLYCTNFPYHKCKNVNFFSFFLFCHFTVKMFDHFIDLQNCLDVSRACTRINLFIAYLCPLFFLCLGSYHYDGCRDWS